MNVIVICGATAPGKSDLAVALAREIDGEVINADSMQLYKGMDIGTAKITLEEQQGVPHHLMDQLDVTEDANVAWYQEKAREKITEVHSRKKNAIKQQNRSKSSKIRTTPSPPPPAPSNLARTTARANARLRPRRSAPP